MAIRYWLGVVHRENVLSAVAQGIARTNPLSRAPLTDLAGADGIVYYSPRTSFPEGDPLQQFTAIGWVADALGRVPRVDYDRDAVAASIRPLLPVLEFTRTNPDWGRLLVRGSLELSRHDFDVIRAQMRRPAADDPFRGRITMAR